jgi:Viral BACON domain
MSQCLRCSKLCEANAVFCEECRSLLRNQLQQRPSPHASQEEPSSAASPLADVPTLAEHGAIQGNPLERITSPLPVVRANQEPQPVALVAHEDLVDQAVYRLNEAAQIIAEEEEQGKSDRKARPYSRAPRLRPIRDISADIRRESTPLPQVSGTPQSEPASRNGLERQQGNGISPVRLDAHASLPDLWPWLDADTEDKENDIWADRTDPLIARHFPNSTESARIEEEDIRRALAEGVSTAPHPIPRKSRASHMRIAFIALAIFALVAFAIDGILIGVAFNQPRHAASTQGGLPTLTLSQNVTYIGSTIQLAIKNFTPSTRVALTHDIQEPINLDGVSSILTVGPAGAAKVMVVIDSDWETGFHLVVAEDLTTRYTASATLLIIGSGPTPPPHLQLDNRPLDLGAAVVGANTIRTFKLTNSGGGSITWSASSRQPWLLVSPSQGTFSSSQTISIAVQRAGLKPGEYRGDLAISSNVSPTQHVEVDMSVQPLPAGPVLALSPALLSFTANDGQSTPAGQTLTISNPGTRPLAWSLASQDQATPTAQLSLLHALGPAGNWLSATPASGAVAPGATAAIQVVVRSQMLPGTYIDTLLFTAPGAVDSPQAVNVSLTVFPHCGIVTSSGFLSFTAVQGQSNLGTQALSLNATVSCSGAAITWKSSGTPSWVAVTPASGQLKGTTSAVVSVSVNTAGLSPNTYSGQISFVTGMSTQTVVVMLVVQAQPPPAEPVMGASPLSLNFSNTQGLPNPTGQVVTITNTGGSPLKWSTSINLLIGGWLSAVPTGGTIAPGQTGQVTITVNTSKLTPGTYAGQVTLKGLDASGNTAPGSPQTVTVNLVMQPPCAITQPSSSALSFSAVQGATTGPTPQTVTFTGTGSCVWPVAWSTKVSSVANWLTVTNANSISGTGQSGSIAVAVTLAGLSTGTYQRTVSISATDASGATAQGSPETFTVTLTILPPCTLSSQASLAFTVAQGQTATAQHVAVSETGTCARPVSWTATGDAASSSWLVLAPASGTDTGTLSVNATTASLVPGTYTGTITIAATDNANVPVVGSPQTIAVTLTVTGFTVSGSVVVCSGPAPACTTSQPLPGATVTLTSGSTTIATVTADAAGNYSFANVALGSYTLSASGTDSNGTHTGSAAATVQGDTTGVIIQTF